MAKRNNNRGRSNESRRDRNRNNTFPGASESTDYRSKGSYNQNGDTESLLGVSKQMVDDVAKFSFNNPAGLPIRIVDPNFPHSDSNRLYFPGLMTINYVYGPGSSDDPNSAVSVAAQNLFAFVRHVNAGATNYDTNDLMLYILAVATAYVLYIDMRRALGLTLMYKQSNRYYNRAILEGLGYNVDDLEAHIPQFCYLINKMVRKLGTLPIPSNLGIVKRLTSTPDSIYEDRNVKKAQLYAFVPAGFYTYEETDKDSSGHLIPPYLKWRSRISLADDHGLFGLNELENIVNMTLMKLRGSEAIATLSGDIMKAYGDNIYHLAEVDESYETPIITDDSVLSAIHNSFSCGTVNELDIKGVLPVVASGLPPYIKWMPNISGNWGDQNPTTDNKTFRAFMTGSRIIDIDADDPTPMDVMGATRFVASSYSANLDNIGVEIPIEYVLHTLDEKGIVSKLSFTSIISPNTTSTDYKQLVSKLSKFDFAPFVYTSTPGSDGYPMYVQLVGDTNNYTTIDRVHLQNMNEVWVLSLWDVPEVAVYKPI